jgi:hypothetical protein
VSRTPIKKVVLEREPEYYAADDVTPVARDGPAGSAVGPGRNKGEGRKPNSNARRWHALNTFLDATARRLTPVEGMVWLQLFRDERGGTVATSQRQIAERAGASLRAVNLAVGRLKELGLLFVVHQGGYSKGVTRYRLEPLPSRA